MPDSRLRSMTQENLGRAEGETTETRCSTGGGREAVSLSVTRAARQVLVLVAMLTFGKCYRTTRLERSYF